MDSRIENALIKFSHKKNPSKNQGQENYKHLGRLKCEMLIGAIGWIRQSVNQPEKGKIPTHDYNKLCICKLNAREASTACMYMQGKC